MPAREPAIILDDAEWALMDVVKALPLEGGGVVDEQVLIDGAAGRTSFDVGRIAEAATRLRDRGFLVDLGGGKVQIGRRAQAFLAARMGPA